MFIHVKIDKCGDCRFLGIDRYFTADPFEHVWTWYCKKSNRPKPETTDKMKVIPESSRIALVENKKDEPIEIPSWCPLRV